MPSLVESVGLIILGLTPSLAWLAFYYQEDCHPEPKAILARAFLMGVFISPLAIIFQLGFVKLVAIIFGLSEAGLTSSVSFYGWAAFVEEAIKLAAVWLVVIRRPEFDEPVDAMIYMIAAALGFAAMENILITFQIIPDGATTTITTLVLRFIGATLLHALASGIVGYFLAVSWFYRQHMKKIIGLGLVLASFMHFVFNIIIVSAETKILALAFTTLLLLGLALLISILFDGLKRRSAMTVFAS